MRPRRILVMVVLVVIAGLGHLAYWHLPRLHSSPPLASRLATMAPAGGIRIWVPYPHQTLARAAQLAPEPERLLEAIAILAGANRPTMPRSLSGELPPASEMLVQWSDRGLWMGLRLYPSTVVLARAASAVGENPWLTGGEVDVGGRRATVRLEGATWSVGGVRPDGEEGSTLDHDEPVLGALELTQSVDPWPAGLYLLRQEGSGIGLRRGVPPTARVRELKPGGIVVSIVRRGVDGVEALWLVSGPQRPLGELPGLGAWAERGPATRLLPAAEIVAALGSLPEAAIAGGQLVATDEFALETIRLAASEWGAVARAAAAGPGPWLEVEVAVAPGARVVADLVRLWEVFPLGSRHTLDRWRSARDLLEAVSMFDRASAWAQPDGSAGVSLDGVDRARRSG